MINHLFMIVVFCGGSFEVPWQRGGRNVELQPFSQVPLILLQAFPSAHFPHSELQSSL